MMKKSDTKSKTGNQPLVSIICRSIDRPLLHEALASIAAQSYSPIEVILVDCLAKGIKTSSFADYRLTLKLVSHGKALGRSAAANAGLDQASGELLMFLDDDDWIGPEHVANLVTALQQDEHCLAVYSSVRAVKFDGTYTDFVFAREYDPVLLRRDNFIPIHAVLFTRTLLDQGCRFDESLDIYEDWDFWLQVSRQTTLRHIDQVTAFYRQGGSSDTGTDDYSTRFQPGHVLADARAGIYEKWRKHWSGAELNQLLGSMDSTAEMQELNQRLAREHRSYAEAREANQLLRGALEYVKQSVKRKLEQNRELLNLSQQNAARLEQANKDLRVNRWHLERHVEELQGKIDSIYASLGWRLMGPFRRAYRLLEKLLLNPLRAWLHFRRHGTEWQPASLRQDPVPAFSDDSAALSVTAPAVSTQEMKARYRAEAETHLNEFINSDLQLDFPVTDAPRVSILLVLFNQAPLTLLCLESVLHYAPTPYELVIINNASSDATSKMLEKIHNVTLVNNDSNDGFVRAVNQGARLCRGEFMLLLNNDAMLHPESIESALNVFQEVQNVGAVGGKILLLDGKLQEAGSFIFADGSCLGYGRHADPQAPEYMFRRPVDYCSGAFLLMKTARFRELGGFDLDYAPAYYEDSDLCVRLQKLGLSVIYEPRAVITHYEFASSGSQEKASELQVRHREVLKSKHRDYLSARVSADPGNLLGARTANHTTRILFIDDRVPHANLGSGYPRSREIANLIAAAGFNLTFYPLQFPQESWADTYASLRPEIEVMVNYGVSKLAAFLHARQNFFDVVIVSRIHNLAVVGEVLKASPTLLAGARLIYDAEALTAPREILARELRGETVSDSEKENLISKEIAAADIADLTICVSPQEAAHYQSRGFGQTGVLGHSLVVATDPPGFERRANLLFVGALRDANSPNVDSLQWFATSVLPLITAKIPDIRLDVVGDVSAATLALIKNPQISFHGKLDDIADYYAHCRIFIAPTRFAAGIPHKIHEAAAHGIPCVCTPLLAQQLGWQSGQELLTASSAADFAAACVRLYNESELWYGLQQAALAAVRRDCSPEQFKNSLLDIVRQA